MRIRTNGMKLLKILFGISIMVLMFTLSIVPVFAAWEHNSSFAA